MPVKIIASDRRHFETYVSRFSRPQNATWVACVKSPLGKKTSKKLQTGKNDLVLETQMKKWKARLNILLLLCGTHFKDRETNKEDQVRIIQKSFPSDVDPSLRVSFKISFLMTSVIYVRKAILIALYDQNSLVSFRPQFLKKSWFKLKERWR